MINLGNKSVFAWLPQLGPVVGWTRTENGRPMARLWAKADDVYASAAPIAAVTCAWDRSGYDAKLDKSSIMFWRVQSTTLLRTRPQAIQRFARADIVVPASGESRVRMAFIHEILSSPSSESVGRAIARDGSLSHVDRIPPGERVPYSFFRCDDPEEVFVQRLFDDLENALKSRSNRMAAPVPDTLSRERRRKACIVDCEVALRPAGRTGGEVLRFAAGCCRYPGVGFDRELAERALGNVADRAEGAEAPDFMVMLGDQIYADATAGAFDVDERLEKYTTRYDAAFGSRQFQRLTHQVPTYMLADDHEIRDGWPNDCPPGPKARAQWDDDGAWWGWRLFLMYQRWHGPDQPASLPPAPERAWLFYQFDAHGVPFFAFDARFERERDGVQIVDREQINAFDRWLDKIMKYEQDNKEWRHVPKFVLSGSVIAPGLRQFENDDECARRSDNWQAYACERAEIAQLIARHGAENVVFLSGDYHCAGVGAVSFQGDDTPPVRGYAIIAPPMYAPFPFANATPRDVSRTGRICSPLSKQVVATYTARAIKAQGSASISVHRRDASQRNYSPDDWSIRVRFYGDRSGNGGHTAPELVYESILAGGKSNRRKVRLAA